MLTQIDHIGIAVSSIEEGIAFYKGLLGFTLESQEVVPSQKVVVAFLSPPQGGPRIELIEPTSPDSAVNKFLTKRGPGLHHLAYRTPNISQALDKLKADGLQLIDTSPRNGAGGHKVAFLHPRSTMGVLLELVEY